MTEDIEHLRFNTAISAMMEFLNAMYETCQASSALHGQPSRELPAIHQAFETLVLLLAPLAPHIAEELWQRLGHPQSLAVEPWPAYEPSVLEDAQVLWVVQVNGKVRARITAPAQAGDDALKCTVLANEQVKRYVDGQTIKQFIVVPKRLVNIVV